MAIRPLNGNPPISCNSACHVARGSAPGTDYGVSEGTVVISPFAGTVTIGFNSRAGDYTSVLSTTGVRVYLMHLKERMVTSGFVNEGQEIALSGGAAGAAYSGDSTGPHLHADIRDSGVQYGMEEWLAKVSGNSSGTASNSQDVINRQNYLNAAFNESKIRIARAANSTASTFCARSTMKTPSHRRSSTVSLPQATATSSR